MILSHSYILSISCFSDKLCETSRECDLSGKAHCVFPVRVSLFTGHPVVPSGIQEKHILGIFLGQNDYSKLWRIDDSIRCTFGVFRFCSSYDLAYLR
jgi:hypothetical protein